MTTPERIAEDFTAFVASDPTTRTVCGVCHGPAARRKDAVTRQPTGPWLHVRTEDWHDSPHNVQPLRGGTP